MRTTLKKGIGRGAGMNGNGRAILPPGALTPVVRYQQPPRKRRGWVLVGKLFLWAGALTLLLVGAVAGGAWLYFQGEVTQVQAHSAAVKRAQKGLTAPPPNAPATALVLGYDKRPHITGSRSDTIMLLRAQPNPSAISMMSLPRDLRVAIHCPGKPVYLDKINSAFDLCGPIGTLDTVKALTGLPINYIITVNFTGFRDIVNKMGGVWVNVDRRYYHSNAGLPGYLTYDQINIQPGYQKLNGGQALHFVRYRHTDNDFVRGARQQAFVKAMRQQVSHASLIALPGILNAVTNNVEVGVGGGGKVSPGTILRYALFAYHLPSGRVFQIHINNLSAPTIGGVSYSYAPQGDILAAVRQFQNPNVQASSEAGAQAGIQKLHHKGLAPPTFRTTVTVLNGNGIAGSATQAAHALQQKGYRIVYPPNGIPANAPSFNFFRTRVFYDPRHTKVNRAAAEKLAKLFGDGIPGALPHNLARLSNHTMLTVVVGHTFHGELAPSPNIQLPPKQPAQVEGGLGYTHPLLKRQEHKVGFTLEVPKVIEAGSIPDPTEAARTYNIQGPHKAVVLVFRRGNGLEYYDIEETDWTGAPVLSGGEQHKIKGRTYDFYWNGPHLHMVVLQQNGATYWVVNSWMDSLTNETMVAIAKSLRPLPLKHHR